MKIKILSTLLVLGVWLAFPVGASAQSYSFAVPTEDVQVYWNPDGSLTIDYTFVFQNDSGASAIDYVDVGVPNANYELGSVTADIGGRTLTDIQTSPYVDPGVAVGLGSASIGGGQSGTLHVRIGRPGSSTPTTTIRNMPARSSRPPGLIHLLCMEAPR
jgi:hypothetical protein